MRAKIAAEDENGTLTREIKHTIFKAYGYNRMEPFQSLFNKALNTQAPEQAVVEAMAHAIRLKLKNWHLNGHDYRATSMRGYPLITIAALHGNQDALNECLWNGVSPNQPAQWHDGLPLDYVRPCLKGIPYSLQTQGASVLETLIGVGGIFTYMHVFTHICAIGRVDLLKHAVHNGTDLGNLRSCNGNTVFQEALLLDMDQGPIIDYLFSEHYTLAYATDNEDRSAMYTSTQLGNEAFCLRLMSRPDTLANEPKKQDILLMAIEGDMRELTLELINGSDYVMGPCHSGLPFEDTPLGRALATDNAELASALLLNSNMHVPGPVKAEALQYAGVKGFGPDILAQIENLPTECPWMLS
ncbi:hypothetical protein BO71DRAFT_435812 [Aspergillus ellipticus CBS 707.79]|uniref:Ankyrin n=1 Tax=Aspergillus ellipticus CBS 707.79 TaxID=1448320 RepID=A0A319CSR7_9EURO|nr:hypothetical protein BO71DRAFT_435812 [Aspergillus ellipticus CBS 707.79]